MVSILMEVILCTLVIDSAFRRVQRTVSWEMIKEEIQCVAYGIFLSTLLITSYSNLHLLSWLKPIDRTGHCDAQARK
jgi:hypothetical protein